MTFSSWKRVAMPMATIASLLLGASPSQGQAASILQGLAANASDLSVYWQLVGTPNAGVKSKSDRGASGLGFELAFTLPGGVRQKPGPKPPLPTKSCQYRDQQYKKASTAPLTSFCLDTILIPRWRDTTIGTVRYRDSIDAKPYNTFKPETLFTFELAIGFSQKGGFGPRGTNNDLFVSVREQPSVSLYATYQGDIPVFTKYSGGTAPYVGLRTGLVSLVGGRAYTDTLVYKFGGDTFQAGPVLGLVNEIAGVSVFVEGSYLWRSIGSIEWDVPAKALPTTLPKSVDLRGWTLAVGSQIQFKPHEGK
jgi:hypothetical protein